MRIDLKGIQTANYLRLTRTYDVSYLDLHINFAYASFRAPSLGNFIMDVICRNTTYFSQGIRINNDLVSNINCYFDFKCLFKKVLCNLVGQTINIQ